jgi:hypothetical protein
LKKRDLLEFHATILTEVTVVIGWLKNVTGSYAAGLYVVGATLAVSAVVTLMLSKQSKQAPSRLGSGTATECARLPDPYSLANRTCVRGQTLRRAPFHFSAFSTCLDCHCFI